MREGKINILYVDDEVNNLTSFKATFRREYNIHLAESGKEGMELLGEKEVQVIITDQRMPEMTGIQFLESIIPSYPEPIRILLTGYADINAVVDAINKGQVYRYISKPWNEPELRAVIENAVEVFSLREENKTLTNNLLKVNEQLEFLLRQKLLS
ncbi:MAG: response regulator [Bacteroidota bacterium]|nr:response regulator [Bacteroidota bacterium]